MPLFGEISVHDSQAVYLGTPKQVVVLTHLWWTDQGHWKTRMHPSPTFLRAQRERVLALADLVVLDTAQPSLPARARPASELRLRDGVRLGIYGRVLVAVLSSDWR